LLPVSNTAYIVPTKGTVNRTNPEGSVNFVLRKREDFWNESGEAN